MNKNYLPTISVIIPCFNGEHRLPILLDSIKMQTYPQDKIEIIVVDDDSIDDTIKIAKEYGCMVVRNGEHNIERGKSIGVEASNGEYIFLIDDDNCLPHKLWLSELVLAVVNEDCVGGQAYKFHYDRKDTLPNRYASLFGINDPTVFYMKKMDKLMFTQDKWTLPGKVLKETNMYYVLEFNKSNLLTIGSQGFLIKKEYLLRATCKPYLYHMDVNMELVIQGFNTYIMLKDSVIHNHSNDVSHFVNKLKRNISLFYSENQYRKYTYNIGKLTMLRLGFTMGSLIIPLIDSVSGYLKIHDPAWFLHPILCFRVAFIYTIVTIKNIFLKKKKNTLKGGIIK